MCEWLRVWAAAGMKGALHAWLPVSRWTSDDCRSTVSKVGNQQPRPPLPASPHKSALPCHPLAACSKSPNVLLTGTGTQGGGRCLCIAQLPGAVWQRVSGFATASFAQEGCLPPKPPRMHRPSRCWPDAGTAKLADVGFSREKLSTFLSENFQVGTFAWQASLLLIPLPAATPLDPSACVAGCLAGSHLVACASAAPASRLLWSRRHALFELLREASSHPCSECRAAPEILLARKVDQKVDIYSYGVLIWVRPLPP